MVFRLVWWIEVLHGGDGLPLVGGGLGAWVGAGVGVGVGGCVGAGVGGSWGDEESGQQTPM